MTQFHGSCRVDGVQVLGSLLAPLVEEHQCWISMKRKLYICPSERCTAANPTDVGMVHSTDTCKITKDVLTS
jgi:hypothetical protein